MVKIDELPKKLQGKIREIRNLIQYMSNHPYDPSLPDVYGASAYFSIVSFIDGGDSLYLINRQKDGINNLKELLCKDGRTDSLRDLIEIEKTLKRLPMDNPYE